MMPHVRETMAAGRASRGMLSWRSLAIAAQLLVCTQAGAMVCTPLGSAGLVIGKYQPLDAVPIDAQTTLAIECFPSVPGEALRLNVRLINAGNGSLQLPNVSVGTQGAGLLRVLLYRDAARTIPLDDQATITFSEQPLIPTRYLISLYARVPAGQDIGVGQYQLPLTVLIDY